MKIQIGPDLFLPCSFTVLEGRDVDMLFGLDMLKRYQASIDLGKNALVIQGRDIRFLDEHELPPQARQLGTQDADSGGGPNAKISQAEPSETSTRHDQKWPEDSVKKLQELGINKNDAMRFLDAANGDVATATNIYFS